MKTRNDSALWPLPAVLALWLFLAVQAVGVWVEPHRPATLTAQCERLQLATAPGLVSGSSTGVGLGQNR